MLLELFHSIAMGEFTCKKLTHGWLGKNGFKYLNNQILYQDY